jgi:hypothetical protein
MWEKSGAGQATDDSMVHVLYMLDNWELDK